MVLTYRRPGVYLEESLLVNPGGDIASTITAGCFVGVAAKGPGNTPTLIESWPDYVRIFGGFDLIDRPAPPDPNDITDTALAGAPSTATASLTALKADPTYGDAGFAALGRPFGPGQYATLDNKQKAYYTDVPVATNKGATKPGDVFATDANVDDVSDLTPQGYVANPTAAWTAGQTAWVGNVAATWDGDSWEAVTGQTKPTDQWAEGKAAGEGAPIILLPQVLSYLPFSVFSFFQNGGRFAWVIRAVPAGAADDPKRGKPAEVAVNTDVPVKLCFKLKALSAGVWGNNLAYSIIPQAEVNDQFVFTLRLYLMNADGIYERVEQFSSLSMNGEIPGTRRVDIAVNDPNNNAGSSYVFVSDLDPTNLKPMDTQGGQVALSDGEDPDIPSGDELEAAADNLGQVEGPINLNIVGYLSDAKAANTENVEDAWVGASVDPITTFEDREDIVVINDNAPPRAPLQSPASYLTLIKGNDYLGSEAGSSYVASYGPWVLIPHPQQSGATVPVPPGGAIIGMMSRIDATTGVFRAPAGVIAGLTNVVGVQTKYTDTQLGDLNSMNINAIRSVVGAGICCMGARTRKSYGVDHYISARRTLISVKESLRRSTQWAVFENNDEMLWAGLRMTADRILRPLWERGGLRGATQDEAYFILCDETINTATVIQSGEVRMEVGVALQYPAEFVIIRITQFDRGTFTGEVQPPR